ncbi:MAG: response regulator [Bryobacterales bacterium]|nr:response regulator [Bryobacteraceae bacterium]MDW8131357.1 response regulator [Bryobacterales bacterium]
MNRRRILVVEDEALVAAHLEACLCDAGFEVVCAASGEEALEKARQVKPHLALMDIRLAGELDGIRTAVLLRQQSDLACVFLSAYADDATLERAREAEPVGYLVKPFEERELRATIEMALRRVSIERRLRERARWQSVVLDAVRDPIVLTDAAGRITSLNRAAETMTSWKAEEACGLRLQELFSALDPKVLEQLRAGLRRSLFERAAVTMAGTVRFECRGSAYEAVAAVPLVDANGLAGGAALLFRELAGSPPQAQASTSPASADEAVAVDPQTGLPGRGEAERAIAKAQRQGSRSFASVFAVDHFRTLIQRYGFSAAEEVLLFFSVHLAQGLAGDAQLYRWSGPAFVAIVERLDSIERVRREMAGLASVRLEKLLQLNTRTALVVISAAWEVFPLYTGVPAEEVVRQIDAFVASYNR